MTNVLSIVPISHNIISLTKRCASKVKPVIKTNLSLSPRAIRFQLTGGEKKIVAVRSDIFILCNIIIMSVSKNVTSLWKKNFKMIFEKTKPINLSACCNLYLLLFVSRLRGTLSSGEKGGSGGGVVSVGCTSADLPIISITVAVSTIASSASSGTRVSLLFCRFNISKEFKFSNAIIGNVLMLNKINQHQLTDRSSEKNQV